ncbi:MULTISPECIES: radical SAM protein [Desulfosediminicola]|uniref:radical SAM protein n=1 Tax=Desulfosediminicola TaxID=2886823 RepID=UPI0010ACB5B6|nr:radical SAM protein [Desulfosediminicola ganghwensis]
MIHPTEIPSLVIADDQGTITDFPDLQMCGSAAGEFVRPELDDLIPLPEGSELFALPMRLPVGCDPDSGEPLLLEEDPFEPGRDIQAVAAFMSPAHTSALSSAFQTKKGAPTLPLFAYTAVGWFNNQFWVPAFRSDSDIRQDCDQYKQETVNRKTKAVLKANANNRLIQHLGKCCLTYGCPAARNYFLGRWEAPLPTSPECNARCVGCISLQESGCCPSTQDRIAFVPTPHEICQMAVAHLNTAERAIVSFGQGCEGEPLLQASTIEKAIGLIRQKTSKGTVNLNSNASLPDKVENLARAGLDSLRVSLNSVQEDRYLRYYRPKGYCFDDVKKSIAVMKSHGKFVSLNYFILPGFTDSPQEFDSLCSFVEELSPDFIQLRNLNMDPEWYLKTIDFQPTEKALGVRNWLSLLKEECPTLKFGYFNPPLANGFTIKP